MTSKNPMTFSRPFFVNDVLQLLDGLLLCGAQEPDAPLRLVQQLRDLVLILFFVHQLHKKVGIEIRDDGFCRASVSVFQVVGIVIPDMGEIGTHQNEIPRRKIRDTVANDPLTGTLLHEIQFTKFMKMKRCVEVVAIELLDKKCLRLL